MNEQIKELTENPVLWAAFEEMIKEKLEKHKKRLEETARFLSGKDEELIEIYRQQGRIYALNNLLKLKDEVALKGVK